MFAATLALGVVLVLAAVGVGLAFRALLGREQQTGAHLHEEGVPTVLYAIPDGADPAALRGELDAAGYSNAFEEFYGEDYLRIECPPDGRDRLRALIEEAQSAEPERGRHVARVRFADEG